MAAPPSPGRVAGGVVAAAALLVTLAGSLLWLSMLAGPWRLASGLLDARAHLERGQRSLERGSLKQARYDILSAERATERAAAAFGSDNPLLAGLQGLPAVRDAWDDVGHLVAAASHSSRAASGSLEIAQTALRGPNKIIFRDERGDGEIRLERVEALQQVVARIRADVRGIAEELTSVERADLPRRARAPIDKGIARARAASRVLAHAEAGFAILPAVLGRDEARTYMLGMQNPAELRGTGGALLRFGFLEIDEGKPQLLPTKTAYDVDKEREPLEIPLPEDAWYVRGIEDAQRFGNANWSPDWPLSAKLTLAYGYASPEPFPQVDGAILVDPIVMRELLAGAGAVHIPTGRKITTNKAVPFLLYRAYGVYPNSGIRRKVLQEVVDGFYERMLKPKHPTELIDGMGASLRTKHMQIWMAADAEQSFIERMDWDGAIEPAERGDYVMAVEQNVGGNKLDYFARQTTRMSVSFAGDSADVSTEIEVYNGVFTPQPRYVLGDSGDDTLRTRRLGIEYEGPLHRPMLNLYVPARSRLQRCETTGERVVQTGIDAWSGDRPAEHLERGKKVWSATVEIPAADTGALRCSYRVSGAVREVDGRSVYRLTVQHQPRVRPATIELSIEIPDGARDVAAPGFARRGATLLYNKRLDEDIVLEVSWRE